MKRSQINAIMQEANNFMKGHGFHLPPFAYWTPEEWRNKGPEVSQIVRAQLGWDITDFGSGNFTEYGLFLFTLRNGDPENLEDCTGKLYAEKIMVVDDGQITPMHFHWTKTEDIINRGGGRLAVQIYKATHDGQIDKVNLLQVSIDSVKKNLALGQIVKLDPGQSITLEPYRYHSFWGEGKVLVGEVSIVNDDQSDNRFLQPQGRYPEIVEDVPPLYLLCTDYDQYYQSEG